MSFPSEAQMQKVLDDVRQQYAGTPFRVTSLSAQEQRVRHLLRRLAAHKDTFMGGVDAGRIEELAYLLLKEFQPSEDGEAKD